MPPGIVVISPGPATVNRREKARVSWWNRAHPTPHAPAGLAEAALINRTARAEDGSHPPRERRGRPRVRHDPIDRRAPGALPYADRPPSAQPLDELPGLTGSEHAPLSRREPPPGDALDLGQRRSESREVGHGHGGEQLHQHEVRDARHLRRSRRRQPPERRSEERRVGKERSELWATRQRK